MKVREIMTLGAITVSPDAAIADAASQMLKHRVSGLPVVSFAEHLVGIVTEGDLMRCAETGSGRDRPGWLIFLYGSGEGAENEARVHAQKVEDAMTREVVSVTPGTPVEEAVDLFEGLGLKRLPVLQGGRVVGIISRSNLLRTLVERKSRPTVTEGDKKARIQALRLLENLEWTSPTSVHLYVRDSVAHLVGTIGDQTMRDRVLAEVENAPGIQRVSHELLRQSPPEASLHP